MAAGGGLLIPRASLGPLFLLLEKVRLCRPLTNRSWIDERLATQKYKRRLPSLADEFFHRGSINLNALPPFEMTIELILMEDNLEAIIEILKDNGPPISITIYLMREQDFYYWCLSRLTTIHLVESLSLVARSKLK